MFLKSERFTLLVLLSRSELRAASPKGVPARRSASVPLAMNRTCALVTGVVSPLLAALRLISVLGVKLQPAPNTGHASPAYMPTWVGETAGLLTKGRAPPSGTPANALLNVWSW